MNRLTLVLATSFTVVAVAASTVRGGFDVVQGDVVKLGDGPGSPGGIFHINVLGRGTDVDFDTYCAELFEHISFNTPYYVESIGLTAQKSGKQLGAQAAWLYTQFLDQSSSLTGFNFLNPTANQANALQLGIYRGMVAPYEISEIQSVASWSSDYIDMILMPLLAPWLTAFGNDSSWSGTGQIQIMNLRKFYETSDGDVTLADGTRIELKAYAQAQFVRITPELPSFYMASSIICCAVLCGIVSHFRRRPLKMGAA